MTALIQDQSWTRQAGLLVPCRRSDIRVFELDGEAVLVDARTGNTYELNETAYAIWRRFNGEQDTGRIARALTDDYDLDYETALDHVEQLVAAFVESGLLETGEDG